MHETFRYQARQFWFNASLTRRAQRIIGTALIFVAFLLFTGPAWHIAPMLICAGGGAFGAPDRRVYRFAASVSFCWLLGAMGTLIGQGLAAGYLWGLIQIAAAFTLIYPIRVYHVHLRRWRQADRAAQR